MNYLSFKFRTKYSQKYQTCHFLQDFTQYYIVLEPVEDPVNWDALPSLETGPHLSMLSLFLCLLLMIATPPLLEAWLKFFSWFNLRKRGKMEDDV